MSTSEETPPSLLERIRAERSGLTNRLLDALAAEQGVKPGPPNAISVGDKLADRAAAAIYDAYFDRLVGVAGPKRSSPADRLLRQIVDLEIDDRTEPKAR